MPRFQTSFQGGMSHDRLSRVGLDVGDGIIEVVVVWLADVYVVERGGVLHFFFGHLGGCFWLCLVCVVENMVLPIEDRHIRSTLYTIPANELTRTTLAAGEATALIFKRSIANPA